MNLRKGLISKYADVAQADRCSQWRAGGTRSGAQPVARWLPAGGEEPVRV